MDAFHLGERKKENNYGENMTSKKQLMVVICLVGKLFLPLNGQFIHWLIIHLLPFHAIKRRNSIHLKLYK